MPSSQERTQLKTVTGFIVELPSKKSDESDDDEDDDDDDNWLDYSQIKAAFSQGTFVKMSRKPRYSRVVIQDHENQKHTCFGRLAQTDPWWNITVHLGPKQRAVGLIQYTLRCDLEGIKIHKLVPLLVNKAFQQETKETADIMEAFDEFIRREKLQDQLIFEQLETLLHTFARMVPVHKNLTQTVLHHDVVQSVLRAHRHPRLLSFLCRLFPLRFLTCLLTPPPPLLPPLEKAAAEEPWVFGFSMILATRFKVFGVEANYKAFQAAGLMDAMPVVQKDALYIYEVLKTDATKQGHTFISFPDLRQHWHWAQLGHVISDWLPALAFLSQNGVIREERFDSKRNVFLYHNWKAEVDIADGLKEVIQRGIMANKPTWNVEFASPDLSSLRGDADQWQAAQKVVASPVCIMSGKGGCGKTTVVTQLIQHVCQRACQTSEPEAKSPVDLSSIQASAELVRLPCPQVEGGKEDLPDDMLVPSLTPDTLPPSCSLPPRAHDTLPPSQATAPSQATVPSRATALTQATVPSQATAQSQATASSQVTVEELPQMINRVTQLLEERQAKDRSAGLGKTKEDQIQIDLTTDLLKYLGASGNTALSRTPTGRKILLTAPTGKAAKLLGRKARMESCTLHRVIYSYRAFVKAQQQKKAEAERRDGGQQGGEEREGHRDDLDKSKKSEIRNPVKTEAGSSDRGRRSNMDDSTSEGEWKYACTQVLVVDECSLVSLRLFATLLKILLDNTPLEKIVLLGDIRQLPSIEPGNFLSDIFATFGERGLSVELRTNHRSESDRIISNATRISRRQLPVFDPDRHFHLCALEDTEDSADPERDAAIRQLLHNQPELAAHESSQFVAFRRAHCDAINELCCQHYNGHATRTSQTVQSKHTYDFRIGDKICFCKNGQVLNKGTQLRAYLQDYPDILEALGIMKSRDKKSAKEDGSVDIMTAVEQILDDDGEDSLEEMQPVSAAGNRGCSLGGGSSSSPPISSDAGARGGVEGGAVCASQPAGSAERKQHLCACSKKALLNSSSVAVKEEESWCDEHPAAAAALCERRQEKGAVQQEPPWVREHSADSVGGLCSVDYAVKATDFGLTMERLSQSPGPASSTNPSVSAGGGGPGRQSGQAGGAEGPAAGRGWNPLPQKEEGDESSSPPQSSQDDEEEEERVGKLKNGIVRLCNGEVYFIMDVVTESEGGSGKEPSYLVLSDRDPQCPRVLCCSYRALKHECRLRHAWARTIHTYQGSESDTVVYYVGDHRGQNWKHVYTAVTRSRKAVFLVGKESELRQAVWERDRPRRSRLARRLTLMMKDLQFQKVHSMVQCINQQASVAMRTRTTPVPQTTRPTSTPAPQATANEATSQASTPPPAPDGGAHSSLVDAFFDSDDSWLADMSPVWAGEYDAVSQTGQCENGAAASQWDLSPQPSAASKQLDAGKLTPLKRPGVSQPTNLTPKHSCSVDPVDSITSPVRRKLRI